MSIQKTSTNNQLTRDELSSEPDVQPIYKVKSEKVIIELGPIKQSDNQAGHSFILGHTSNGVMGSPALGDDGSQVVLGEAGRSETVLNVFNVNKFFIERFNFTTFNATGSTTADWAVTTGLLEFTTGEVAVSKECAFNDGTITRATMNLTPVTGVTTDLTLELTADGGSNWESVTLSVEHTFTNTGNDLRFRLTASGTVSLSLMTISYN
jgi:hypothetical protein